MSQNSSRNKSKRRAKATSPVRFASDTVGGSGRPGLSRTPEPPSTQERFLFYTLRSGKTFRLWVPPGFDIGEPDNRSPAASSGSGSGPVGQEPEVPPEDMECPVCSDQCDPSDKLKACGHYLCRECFENWLAAGHSDCPICRTPFVDEEGGNIVSESPTTYSGEGEWQTRQVLIAQLDRVYPDLQPNEIYDTYRIFYDLDPGADVVDIDPEFISKLRANRIVLSRDNSSPSNAVTYRQEFDRLRFVQGVYERWVNQLPSTTNRFSELTLKAAFFGLRKADTRITSMSDRLPVIPTAAFLQRVEENRANYSTYLLGL